MRFALATTAALLAASAHAAPRPHGTVDAIERRAALDSSSNSDLTAAPLALNNNDKPKRWFTLAPRQEGESTEEEEAGLNGAGEGAGVGAGVGAGEQDTYSSPSIYVGSRLTRDAVQA